MNLLRELITFEPNCDCIKVTYQLVGEEPVTVELDFIYILNGKNIYKFFIDDVGFSLFWDSTNWILSNDNEELIEVTLSEDTPCPFGNYTIEEGSIFESFIVEPCY